MRWIPDYKANQREGLVPPGRYYIVLVDDTAEPVYEYSRMVGKIYSRLKSTRKAYFMPVGQVNERVYFDQYQPASRAMIEIGKTSTCNVPVGRYNLQVRYTTNNECVAVLPYDVKKEVTNEQLEAQC